MKTWGDDVLISNGADLIAAFIEQTCFPNAFVVNGGAAVFIIDALERNTATTYTCFQHEQSSAMAADAVYRVSGKVGVTVVTSGPGATNLITGIASSWFDSIPALHITGQVNDNENKSQYSPDLRQAGFQETNICHMVQSITKSATQVHSIKELSKVLGESLAIAISGRMGPVLIDVPMNVQQEQATNEDLADALKFFNHFSGEFNLHRTGTSSLVTNFFRDAERPLVVLGGGLARAGTTNIAQEWCEKYDIPYVASWAGKELITTFGNSYQGTQGVYGLRHSNWCVQSADRILVLGSRLDNRQRTGNPKAYAPYAQVLVVDIDQNELNRLSKQSDYQTLHFDLSYIDEILPKSHVNKYTKWLSTVLDSKSLQNNELSAGMPVGEIDPYRAFELLDDLLPKNSEIIADTGATLCWLFQSLSYSRHQIFTSGGNSPMGYALPAAIGAALANPKRHIICVIGDGGLQMNIQELQTVHHYQLPIHIIVINNNGYGIIKQFQNSNTQGRHSASGKGYSTPNFQAIAEAYSLAHIKIDDIEDLKSVEFGEFGQLIEIQIPQDSLVQPKAEGNKFLHDQFPHIRPYLAPAGYEYPIEPMN